MKKIVIPIEESRGEDSMISHHFGRSPLLAIVEVSDNKSRNIKLIKNFGEHFRGRGNAVTSIISHNPDALIVKGMGTRALQFLQDNGIEVYSTELETIKEAIESYLSNELTNLTEPCKDSRHHH